MRGSYTLFEYGTMVDGPNRLRANAFTEALRRNITPQSVVMDIGTGAGYFAMVAAKLGAAYVYAVDPNPVVKMAEKLARENDLADRITFFQEDSTRIELPQKADIILGDLGGALPIAGPNIPAFMDARTRHLAPRGITLPAKARLWGGVVSKPEHYRRMTHPWEDTPLDLDFRRARSEVVNTPQKIACRADELLTDSACWFELDYATVDSANATGELALTAFRTGTAHGIALWLEYDFGDDQLFSAAPTAESQTIYAQFFLPLPKPVDLSADDGVGVSLRARQCKNDFRHIWSWDTRIQDAESREKASFQQASLPALTA